MEIGLVLVAHTLHLLQVLLHYLILLQGLLFGHLGYLGRVFQQLVVVFLDNFLLYNIFTLLQYRLSIGQGRVTLNQVDIVAGVVNPEGAPEDSAQAIGDCTLVREEVLVLTVKDLLPEYKCMVIHIHACI